MINLFDNFFSVDELKEIDNFIDTTKNNFEWRTSFAWDNNIKYGVDNLTLCRKAPNFVFDKLQKHFNTNKYISTMIYLWFPNSHIAWHNDTHAQFAGTIYLNENWNVNHGGYFMYSKSNEFEFSTDNLRTIIPQYNMMLVNSGNTPHCVTPTISTAGIRKTIQFFIKEL